MMTDHDRRLAHERVKALKQGWGKGWARLTPEMREALVAKEVVSVVLLRADATPVWGEFAALARAFYREGGV